ncbi:MAG: hypothetical protein K2K97_12390 [Muribaculaceae bacterium]|nr:hypothetical protein [Muribaculaceae bacterium]
MTKPNNTSITTVISNLYNQFENGTEFEIEPDSISKALLIVKNLDARNKIDILTILCSLNLLNAAIKLDNFKNNLSYAQIKGAASKLVSVIDKLKDDSIKYYYDTEEECLYFDIDNIIFSFHQVPKIPEILKASFMKPITWSGIRLHRIAQPMFEYILSTDSHILNCINTEEQKMQTEEANTKLLDIPQIIIETYNELPSLPGWYRDLNELFRLVNVALQEFNQEVDYVEFTKILEEMGAVIKTDYLNKLSGEKMAAIKLILPPQPFLLSEEQKTTILHTVKEIVMANENIADAKGWYDLVLLAPLLQNAGITKNTFGGIKLSTLLINVFGESIEYKTIGTQAFLKFKFDLMSQNNTIGNSQSLSTDSILPVNSLDNIPKSNALHREESEIAPSNLIVKYNTILDGLKIDDKIEVSSYGINVSGRIKNFGDSYVEIVETGGSSLVRISYGAISTVRFDSPSSESFDLFQLHNILLKLLEQSSINLDSAIATNATIIMVDSKRIWLTTDEGQSSGCFRNNIIGYDKEKMIKGQRVFSFPVKKEISYSIIVEMTYRALLENLSSLVSSINEKNFTHKRTQCLTTISFLLRQFRTSDIYPELKRIKLYVKHSFNIIANDLSLNNGMSDEELVVNKPSEEIEALNSTSTESCNSDNDSEEGPHTGTNLDMEIDSERDTKEQSSELYLSSPSEIFKPEVISLTGPKIIGQIDLEAIKDRRREKKVEMQPLSSASQSNTDEPIRPKFLPTNGTLLSIGPNYGWILPDGENSQRVYVPVKEIISHYGILPTPEQGERVTFSLGSNSKGPIAICVHKECTRETVEQLVEKFNSYDKSTARNLKNQLSEFDASITSSKLSEYLTMVSIDPNSLYNPDDAEIRFSTSLSKADYVKAVDLLIHHVIKDNISKSYNLFLRASSYARSHGMIEDAKHFIDFAIRTFSNDRKKVGYFNSLIPTIKSLEQRIPITQDTLRAAIHTAELQYGEFPKYVKNELIANTEFKGIRADKDTVRLGLYKESYITDVKRAINENSSDEALYLTLIQLELSFNAKCYNPTPDYIKFLTNRARNIISTGNKAKYDEARYLLRVAFSLTDFEKGNDSILRLYLLTLGGYSSADIDLYQRGFQDKYKFDEVIKRVLTSSSEGSDLELAYLSSSNPSIAERISHTYLELGYSQENLKNFGKAIHNLNLKFGELIENPITKYSSFINIVKTDHISVPSEQELIYENSSKLISKLTEYMTSSKYSVMKTTYVECQHIIRGMLEKLESQISLISYEYLTPLLGELKRTLNSNFSIQEKRISPNINLEIIGEASKLNKNTYDLNIVVRSLGDSARDITLKTLKVEGEDLIEFNELLIDKTLVAGQEITLGLSVDITDESIVEGVAQGAFSLVYEDIYVSNEMIVSQTREYIRRITIRKEEFIEIDNKFKGPAGGNELDGNNSMFYGRNEMLTELENIILNSWNSQIAVYGQKRTGKSSLVNRLKSNLEHQNNIICVKFSLQGFSKDDDSSIKKGDLEMWIMRKIALGLSKDRKLRPFISKEDINLIFNANPDPFAAIEQFVLNIRDIKELCDVHFVIMIDEFTALYQSIKDGLSDKNFMKRWKALVETPGLRLQSVIVAQDTLPLFINEEYAANGFGIFNLKLLTYLSREETINLITDPIKEIKFHAHSDETIYEYTSGSPLFTQKICSNLIDCLNRQKKSYTVTGEEIEDVINRLCVGTERLEKSSFECLINEADGSDFNSNDNEVVLKSLALQTRAGGSCLPEDLESEFPLKKVKDILNHLLSRRVVSKSDDGGFSINIKLFRRWILNQ